MGSFNHPADRFTPQFYDITTDVRIRFFANVDNQERISYGIQNIYECCGDIVEYLVLIGLKKEKVFFRFSVKTTVVEGSFEISSKRKLKVSTSTNFSYSPVFDGVSIQTNKYG
ncbi:hypothetical protein AVEN_235400-1 [Araneus ventricosus]|uniref:Uncharacterized protein n=1 Tax=Araneus ventricosus TaxID=182803 RepID=A0A4Y2A6A6_ARAVE|nr:hypothetical protein AVEN_235400-1 [Araneus ventricosus]